MPAERAPPPPSRAPLVKLVAARSALAAAKVAQGVPLLAVARALAAQPDALRAATLAFCAPPDAASAHARRLEASTRRGRDDAPAAAALATARAEWVETVRQSRGLALRPSPVRAAAPTADGAVEGSFQQPLLPAPRAQAPPPPPLGAAAPLPARNPAVFGSVASSHQPLSPRPASRASGSGSPRAQSPPAIESGHSGIARPLSRGSLGFSFSEDPLADVAFGTVIALESTDGWFLSMHPTTGVFSVREPEAHWAARRAAPFEGAHAPIFTFRVTNMVDIPLHASATQPVQWRDGVWLVAVDGTGEAGWRTGAVLAARVARGAAIAPLSARDTWEALGGRMLGPVTQAVADRDAAGAKAARAAAPVQSNAAASATPDSTPDGASFAALRAVVVGAEGALPTAARPRAAASSLRFIDPDDGVVSAQAAGTPRAPSAEGALRSAIVAARARARAARLGSGTVSMLDRAGGGVEHAGFGVLAPAAAFVPTAAAVAAGSVYLRALPTAEIPEGLFRPTDMSFPGIYSRRYAGVIAAARWTFRDASAPGAAAARGGGATLKNFALVALAQGSLYVVHEPARADGGAAERGREGLVELAAAAAAAAIDSRPASAAGGSAAGDAAAPAASATMFTAPDSAHFIYQAPDGCAGGNRRIARLGADGSAGIDRRGIFRVRVVGARDAPASARAEPAGHATSSSALVALAAATAHLTARLSAARALRLGAATRRAPPVDAFGNAVAVECADAGDETAAESMIANARDGAKREQAAADDKFLSFELARSARGEAHYARRLAAVLHRG